MSGPADPLEAYDERALADDLADSLGSLLDIIDFPTPTADAALARYREARQQ